LTCRQPGGGDRDGVAEVAQEANLLAFSREHVDALSRTLARESRHIVAFEPLSTISRAAVLIFNGPVSGVNARSLCMRPARAKGFCRQGFSAP
jgi:hypothetical protein